MRHDAIPSSLSAGWFTRLMLLLFLLAGALTTRGASAAELAVVQVAPQKSPSAVV